MLSILNDKGDDNAALSCILLTFQSEHVINAVFLSFALDLSSIWNLCLSMVGSCWSLDSFRGGGWKVVASLFFSILNMVLFLFFWPNCKMSARHLYFLWWKCLTWLRTALLGYLICADIPAHVCKAAGADWNPAALVLKQRGLCSHSVSVLGLLCLFLGLRTWACLS